MSSLTSSAHFQPTGAEFIADPYAFYAELGAPVLKDGPMQWLISGHQEVSALLRHPGLRGDWPAEFQQLRVGPGPTSEFITDIVLHREGEQHAELRRALVGVLHGPAAGQIGELTGAITDEQLDQALDGATVDLVPRLAVEIPVRITCRLLGIPEADVSIIRTYGMTAMNAFTTVLPETDWPVTDEAIVALRDYLRELSASAGHVLHAAVERCHERAPFLSHDVVIHNLVFLLVSGFTTSVHLISSMLGEVARRPGLWAKLRESPDLAGSAVEEFARFGSPIQHVSRLAVERIELDQAVIRPGRVVHLLLGAANRDPAVFERADQLDPARDPNPHLAFGRGLHACLGAQLGRAEAIAMLNALLARVSRIEATKTPTTTARQVFRAYASVPVSLTPV